MSRRLISAATGAALLALFSGVHPAAQTPAESQQPPIFRGGVDSVSVDVIVTDKSGKPVTDLTTADFEIRENGRLQTIDTFKFVRTDDGSTDSAAQRDILSFDEMQREVARTDNRLLIILLDDYHVRVGNSVQVREQLAAFVSQLTAHDLVAVATPLSSASALTFTRNHDATASELMGFTGRKYNYTPKNALEERYAYEPPIVQERLRNQWVISQLKNLCDYFGTLRDGRKTILFVSEGMSGSLPSGVQMTGPSIPARPPTGAPDPTGRQASANFFESASLLSDLQRVFEMATRTNTSVYTIDPRGLTSSEFNMGDNVTSTADRQILQEATDMLRVIAEQTDGRAIVGRNDPLPALRQMVADGSTYYLLGYISSLAPRDGKFHPIQVRVKRPNVEVRARKGYWALTPEDITRASAPPKPALPTAIVDALDTLAATADSGHARAVNVWMGATRGAGEKAVVTMTWEAGTPESTAASDRVDHVTVLATSIYGDTLFTGRVDRDPQASPAAGKIVFDAPAGQVRVRVQAENANGRRLESTDAELEVPDYTTPAVGITVPFIYRGRTARDLQLARTNASTLPATSRIFSRSERLLLRFEAFGPAGSSPTVAIKLLNQNGSPIATMPEPTKASGATFESEFSLGAFPPGDYLLEITATQGAETAKSLIAIRVRG